jgi:8-oxo-dGTP pyrophosphatase MutT (NUDIX family)
MKKIYTVCYFINIKTGEILLGEKTVRLGAGFFNGPGGTLEPGQTIFENAIDEATKESGLIPIIIEECGISLIIGFPNGEQRELHYFLITKYQGKLLKESDEMKNFKWYAKKDIPYSQMFRNDSYTLPLFFKRKKCVCLFNTNESDWNIHRPIIEIVKTLPTSLNITDFM